MNPESDFLLTFESEEKTPEKLFLIQFKNIHPQRTQTARAGDLILVLMDLGLIPIISGSIESPFTRFNPCFNGSWSYTTTDSITATAKMEVSILVLMDLGLIPLSGTNKSRHLFAVSILVLMDLGLILGSGIHVSSRIDVSILVLMDLGLIPYLSKLPCGEPQEFQSLF